MNFSKDKLFKKFSNKKWYRQGGLIVPFFECGAMKAVAEIVGEDNYVGVYRGEKNHGYMELGKYKEGAYDNIKKQLKDINHVDNLYKDWKQTADKCLDLIKDKVDIKELLPKIKEFWDKAWVIEFYDAWGEDIINEYIKLTKNDKQIILTPEILSKPQEEDLDLLKLALTNSDQESIHKHQNKYYYIKASWADATEYSAEEIKEKLKKIKEKSDDEIKNEIEEIESYNKNTNLKASDLLKNLDDGGKKVAYFFRRLAEWRDERKVIVQKTNCYLQKFLLKIEKETSIGLKYLKFINTYNLDNEIDEKLLKERYEISIDFLNDGKWNILGGNLAKEVAEMVEKDFTAEIHEIKGMSASSGKVKAKARVVLSHNDFSDFQEGEILVAVSTRPEFVPLMKKAAAIITDEGGVTSHAAIVSRELKIPCIVGTQKATGAIKTGMLIEVDADKGTVRKI